MTRYKIPLLMAGDVETAARMAESILCRWYREHVRVIETVAQAARDLQETA